MQLTLPKTIAGAIVVAYLIFGAAMLGIIHLRHPVAQRASNTEQTVGVKRAQAPNPNAPPAQGGATMAVPPKQAATAATSGQPSPTVGSAQDKAKPGPTPQPEASGSSGAPQAGQKPAGGR